MFQQELLQQIQQQLPANTSLNEVISSVLDISYDAGHRRVSLKSKLSLEESILLAKHFGLSIDQLFSISKKEIVAVEKTTQIDSEKTLESYFTNSYKSLQPLTQIKQSSILYSAKDIPIFYTSQNKILGKFKFYVWLKLLDDNFNDIRFDDYQPSKPLVEASKKLGNIYTNIQTTEIWDITTINSLLKQIHYYFLAHQLSFESALLLSENLKKLIQKIEKKLIEGSENFKLYYNELLLMNNNVLAQAPNHQLLYVPFTMLSYYKTNDKNTCNQAKVFFDKQLKNSKLLNTAGEKEQKTFFNKMYSKIDALHQLIKATKDLDFE